MTAKLKELFLRYKEAILYLFFGGMTTLIDFAISFVLYYFWGDAIEETTWLLHIANGIAWAAAVIFAYVTNRIWVFESPRHGFLPIVCEFSAFAGGRVLTFLMQEGIFALCCDWLHMNEYAVKIAASVIVLVSNYVISKLLIFRKKKQR